MADRLQSLPVGEIVVGDRLRKVDPAWVEVLADSMRDVGQIAPIAVRQTFRPGELRPTQWTLVDGAHRIEAARLLGWAEVAVHVTTVDARAELREIDANLIRNELTALDRARFLAERKRLYERLHPETERGANYDPERGGFGESSTKSQSGQPGHTGDAPRFSADAAEKTRLSERTIRRAVQLAERLNPDAVELLAPLPVADKEAELRRLAATDPAHEQVRVAKMLAGHDLPEPAQTVAEAIDLAVHPGSLKTYCSDPAEWRASRKRKQRVSASAAAVDRRHRAQMNELREALGDEMLDPVARVLRATVDLDESQRDILIYAMHMTQDYGPAIDMIVRRWPDIEPPWVPPELRQSAVRVLKTAKAPGYDVQKHPRSGWFDE